MKNITCTTTALGKRTMYLLLLLCASALFSCNKDNVSDNNLKGKLLKLQKLDLSNAKYLSIQSDKEVKSRAPGDAESENGLFKIDKEGNVSTVLLTCLEEEDGSVTKTRNDIKVIPRHLIALSENYTLMRECEFIDEQGVHISMSTYYEPNTLCGFNILVRNSDGAIFYIPSTVAEEYFMVYNDHNLNHATTDKQGNLYLIGDRGNLGMVTISGNILIIKQVNPNGIEVVSPSGSIWPLENKTVVIPGDGDCEYLFLYPNGGFENMEFIGEHPTYLSKVSNGLKAVSIEERVENHKYSEVIVSLHDYTVGTFSGNNTLSAPIASISSGRDFSTDLGQPNYIDWVAKTLTDREWVKTIYESSNFFLLGRCLVVDKQNNSIRALEPEQSNNVILPTPENTYQGKSWAVSSEDIRYFNLETLEYGTIQIQLPEIGAYQIIDFQNNIPAGEAFFTAVRNSDGKQVTFIIDILSGSTTCTIEDNTRPITTLIPLN